MDKLDDWKKKGWWWKYGNELGIWDYCASISEIYGGGGLDFHLTLYSSKNLKKGISGPGCILIS
jgi:hypothetical protein